MRRALITGITGQDGSYLAEFLLGKGYEVHGIVRRTSIFNRGRIDPIVADYNRETKRLFLHYGDLTDSTALGRLLREIQPEEVYNLAAQSHVKVSFENPGYTADVVGMGTLRILESIRQTNPEIRFYQASSSEMFGKVRAVPQNENTPFHPRNPYGVAKVFAYWSTINYREAYNLHASNGILFNHESPRRGENFVTRKITRAAARIKKGLQKELILGNLEAQRDWGYAKDYVEAMWLMIQAEVSSEYVVATGEAHSVREFLEVAFGLLGLNWQDYVRTDHRYERPAEVDILIGDASKAKKELGWKPKTDFNDLVKLMVEADLKELER
ncbi:MAG: GDP-mannose 4,6-dehydratase [Verrucomicrobia subdivision 3 bacterium]|nr:GDP-mannose 4,6-dehydratase [Limisphaerales bacterium]MCS1415854.1 GDP-mannose 4,6-dehydratase [Limisphaerales bacterium]